MEDTRAYTERESLVLNPDLVYNKLLTPARYKIFYGGRGGAKSWSFAEALLLRALREPIRVLCTREIQASITDSVHKLLKDTIVRMRVQQWFKVTQTSIIGKYTGAEFIFKGLKDLDSLKSAESIDVCWIEEGHKVPKSSMKKLVPTIRKYRSEIWISLNPEDVTDYVYQEYVLKPPPRSIVEYVTWRDNPHFPEELEHERQADLMKIEREDNPKLREQLQSDYDHVWEGHCKRISDEIIYSGKFVEQAFDDNLWKKADRLLYGVDWGFSQDPLAIVRFFIYGEDLYIEYEAGGIGIELEGQKASDGRGEMEQAFDSVPDIRLWPIKADNARPETISFMKNKGYNISAAEKWQGSVEDGITFVKSFRRVYVHPRCKKTIYESKEYRYKVDRVTGEVLPVILDKNNHYMDAIRYGLDGYIHKGGVMGVWEKLGRAVGRQ